MSSPTPTPIKFVDTQAETIDICNQWRDAAAAKQKAYEEALAKKESNQQTSSLISFGKAVTGGGRLLLGIDLEGRDLGHDGTIDILAIYDVDANTTYLFDTCVMQEKAFTTSGDSNAWSLKELIEIGGGRDGNIVFLVYDVRMDAAALFHLYGVRLGGKPSATATAASFGGVYDLQIPQCCISGGQYLTGLARALGCFISPADNAATEKGRAVFAPERGGNYAEWAHRPLNRDLMTYCAVTIRYYGALFEQLTSTTYGPNVQSVMEMTEHRLAPQVNGKIPKMRHARRDF